MQLLKLKKKETSFGFLGFLIVPKIYDDKIRFKYLSNEKLK